MPLNNAIPVTVNELSSLSKLEPFCATALMSLLPEVPLSEALKVSACLAACQPSPTCPEATSEHVTAPFCSLFVFFLHTVQGRFWDDSARHFISPLLSKPRLNRTVKMGSFSICLRLMVHQIIWRFCFHVYFQGGQDLTLASYTLLPKVCLGTLKYSLDPALPGI